MCLLSGSALLPARDAAPKLTYSRMDLIKQQQIFESCHIAHLSMPAGVHLAQQTEHDPRTWSEARGVGANPRRRQRRRARAPARAPGSASLDINLREAAAVTIYKASSPALTSLDFSFEMHACVGLPA
ncbi:hypothetical protein EVAR_52911_1 [Eumeta japonica]|uniref:Uncharacterized protein n=1 Tax=Eumeta variegata TaxID=151549 RepID=A0A4C1Y8P7_EUMVA|nr:hypothetical protein EVAR_52911_1 [Eumeta japonica]